MDLTTLTMFVMLFTGVVSVDTVLHPTSVVLDATVTGKIDQFSVDSDTLDDMLTYEVGKVVSTPSILAAPEVRPSGSKSITMALAETVRLGAVAVALQGQLGYQPEQIKLTMLNEGGSVRLLVSGAGMGGRIHTPPFQEQITLNKGEDLTAFVHRGSILGMSKIDPYITSLFLLHEHVDEGDFSQAEALIKQTKAQLPQTPVSFDRSVFENLQGMIALLRNQLDEADTWFHAAIVSDPRDSAAELNGAFLDLQLGKYKKVIDHIDALARDGRPTDKLLLSTAHMTSAAAWLALKDYDKADRQLAKAVQIYPSSSAAYELWSEVKKAQGDMARSREYITRAWQLVDPAESYAEVAALHFGLLVEPGKKLTPSPLRSAAQLRYN